MAFKTDDLLLYSGTDIFFKETGTEYAGTLSHLNTLLRNSVLKKYMVVERFKEGCLEANYERYDAKGRMFPSGLYYLNSWVNKELNICYQLMESNDIDLFYQWFKNWEDFVDFELVPLD